MLRIRHIYDRLNQMLDDGINGTFKESDYNESELSRLETKWKRYLTSLSLSKDKMEQEKKNLQELISNISHQTKTPLSNILLYTQLLQEALLDKESAALVTEILHYSQKLEFLIQSLIKASRLETGTFQLTPKRNNLLELMLPIADEMYPMALEKNISITIHIAENHYAFFDAKWTKEAIANLLDNAVKYSPAGSSVRVQSKIYTMFACLGITDEGMGIAEDETNKIFGRFYRGTQAREQEGVGIGLYLSRQIIENQGGYIKVVSTPGKGTNFQVYLPIEKVGNNS